SRSAGAPWGTASGDGRHRPHTTRAIVRGIGPPRPDTAPQGVRKPAPASPDHGHDPCRRTRRERGRPVHPQPFGRRHLTRIGYKTHSCSLIKNGGLFVGTLPSCTPYSRRTGTMGEDEP